MGDEKVVWIDQDAIRQQIPEAHGTGGFSTAPSPYDVPEAIRSYREPSGDAVIELQYIGPDEPYQLVVCDHVKVKVGKNSGRIYGFRYEPTDAESGALMEQFHRAIATFIDKPQCLRKYNYRLVDYVVDHQMSKVLVRGDADGKLHPKDLHYVGGGFGCQSFR